MKSMITIFALVFACSSLTAVPRFAMMEDVNCASCHTYQGGGGSRASYGKDYARESLVMKDIKYPWDNEGSESPFSFGLDTRYQMIAESDKDLRQFPMQFAVYGGAEFGRLISHVEVSRILEDFRVTGNVRYEGLPLESWVSVGRELPVMGWRIDDHNVFTRGGNLTTLGLSREGMPYTPFIEPPTLVEFGTAALIGLELTVMAGTPFIGDDEVLDESIFSAVKMKYSFSTPLFRAQAGLAFLDENQTINATVASWGIASNGWVWLGEISQMSGWTGTDISNFASMQQLSYRLFQGLDIIGRYEFFDPNMDLSNGAIVRTSLGLEFFPIRGLEVKMSYRTSQLELPDSTPDPQSQILSQIHLYL
ncbi:MAG: hypothetical protein HQ507_09325 [Candidatus Marinimicrobia bacterium]|nr:hypothetical protein [Candidatus Neomarinimicrobiota bacterium]